jgi:hypothetical protein
MHSVDDLTAVMAKPLGDALPNLSIQLTVDKPTTGHRRYVRYGEILNEGMGSAGPGAVSAFQTWARPARCHRWRTALTAVTSPKCRIAPSVDKRCK